MSEIIESEVNLIAEGTRLEGKVTLDRVSRVHGHLLGDIEATEGSLFVLAETGLIEGVLRGDSIVIDGFVRGDIEATTRVVISGTGRVVGDIRAPAVRIDFGAHFEGKITMDGVTPNGRGAEAPRLKTSPAPLPA